MRNIFTLLIILYYITGSLAAQTDIPTSNTFYSAPSAASIPTHVNNPVSVATGVPDITFPFFTLPTHNNSISANIGMRYHPNNSGINSRASELGLGWSMYGTGGVIYRDINDGAYSGTGQYYYDFMGRKGKFKFAEDPSGVWTLVKITDDNLRISFSPSGGDYKFIISDEMGNSYIFDTRDKSYDIYSYQNSVGAYYLTRVLDAAQTEILSFGYLEDNYTLPGQYAGQTVPVKSLRANTITSPDYGSVVLQYTVTSGVGERYTDKFKLNTIELRNTAGKRVQKYEFQSTVSAFTYPGGYYPVPSSPDPCAQNWSAGKRVLQKLIKYGQSTNFQTTEFTYDHPEFLEYWSMPFMSCFEEEYNSPRYLNKGLLTKIKLPTGGDIRYEYEPNQYYINKNTPYYLTNSAPPNLIKDRDAQYYEDVGEYTFDFTSGPVTSFFTLPPSPDNTEGSSYLQAELSVSEYYPNPILDPGDPPVINMALTSGVQTPSGTKYMPGNNTFQLTGTGGKGVVIIKRIRYKSVPLPNYSTGYGVRIKKIEYYDNNVLQLANTKRYYYSRFDNAAQPSGVLNPTNQIKSVVYQNVKEVAGDAAGHTKYTFKTIRDYLNNLDSNGNIQYATLEYANILEGGLLEKQEIFHASGASVALELNSFEYGEMPETNTITYPIYDESGIPGSGVLKLAYVKKVSTASTKAVSNGSITRTSEILREQKDRNITYRKSVESDGTVIEENIKYPSDIVLTDPYLFNAGVRSIPLIVETKRNGTVISKSETKYENTAHFFPTSQVSYFPDSLSQSVKQLANDIYDDRGNLVQFTAFPEVGTGNPTTVIWGYNKTMPIAKIEGAKLSDIPSALISSIVAASNSDANAAASQEAATELALIDALNTFRTDPALKNFMVSCYTYDPLVGVSNLIPPTGMMETYRYDSYNRLHTVVDVNGVTLKEYQYNYKQ